MVADPLTEPLFGVKFEKLVTAMGVKLEIIQSFQSRGYFCVE